MCETKAQCRESEQVFMDLQMQMGLSACASDAFMHEPEQELKQQCDHLNAVRAKADSAETRESDLKADLKQAELELQLTQAFV